MLNSLSGTTTYALDTHVANRISIPCPHLYFIILYIYSKFVILMLRNFFPWSRKTRGQLRGPLLRFQYSLSQPYPLSPTLL
jgi:hypothetical protein